MASTELAIEIEKLDFAYASSGLNDAGFKLHIPALQVARGQSLALIDGQLITGQNPASSEAVANALLGLLH